MHCGAEVTESSTNKQHHLSLWRSKCYAFKTKNNVVKKAKGVHNVVVKNKISVDDYNNCVLNDKPKNVNAIRTLKLANCSSLF